MYHSNEKADKDRGFQLMFLWPSLARDGASTSIVETRWRKTFNIIPAAPFKNVINCLSFEAQNAVEYSAAEPRNVTGMSSSDSTWSPAEIELAKIWIAYCVDGHSCSRKVPAPCLPSRLVHVGTCEQPSARLRERSHIIT